MRAVNAVNESIKQEGQLAITDERDDEKGHVRGPGFGFCYCGVGLVRHLDDEMHVVSEREGDVDTDQVDDCVLALLLLTLHDSDRSWKGFDFEVMDRLFQKGYMYDPRGKAKSVVLTKEGLARSEKLFAEMFKNP
jgi:hypothetical protein